MSAEGSIERHKDVLRESERRRDVIMSNDYGGFRAHETRRPLRIDYLMASMKRYGFLSSKPIICVEGDGDGPLTIVDGRRRFVTAKLLKLPIWFVTVPGPIDLGDLQLALTELLDERQRMMERPCLQRH
jgi:ParB-like chromosome segregation protein Spo0J